jgi:hypothetical protein
MNPSDFLARVERLARDADQDISAVLPEVRKLVGAIDYTTPSTSSPLFEPVDEHTFRVSPDFLKDADSVGICWQRRSSLAVRPDSEAFTVAIALLGLAVDDHRLNVVDAIRVFVNWRRRAYRWMETCGNRTGTIAT